MEHAVIGNSSVTKGPCVPKLMLLGLVEPTERMEAWFKEY